MIQRHVCKEIGDPHARQQSIQPTGEHRHDLVAPQNATGIPEHTELEREGKPCLRRPITADDLDILGNEAVVASARNSPLGPTKR